MPPSWKRSWSASDLPTARRGLFQVDELALVKGIGLKTVERNRDLITVGPAKAAPQARPAQAAAQAKAPVARR